jgi:hypothetical protein
MADTEPQTETNRLLVLTAELREESDRAVAILAGSFLDHLLRRLITAALKLQDFPPSADRFLFEGPNAGLASFYSKIEIAKHLSLCDEDEFRDLHRIRKVRNRFAHDLLGVSFETASIGDRCKALLAAQIDGRPATPREFFLKASIRLMVDILRRIQLLSEETSAGSEHG